MSEILPGMIPALRQVLIPGISLVPSSRVTLAQCFM